MADKPREGDDGTPLPANEMPCPTCGKRMHLFGIERESDSHELYSFACAPCDGLAVRSVANREVPAVK